MTATTIQIVRLAEGLPDDFEALRQEASAESYRFVEGLHEEWLAGHYDGGDERFVTFAAFHESELAGIGALTPDPYDPAPDLLRVCERDEIKNIDRQPKNKHLRRSEWQSRRAELN